jgi:MoaA/NifB/PqqE/SkfB family radical SAM enzyme
MSVLRRLPLVTIYLSERCNSRCVTCDYWRHGKTDATLESVRRVLPELRRLRTRVALLSGGEPLLNPQWFEIAQLLKSRGLKLWLLTSGLSLAKHARRVVTVFDSLTVSLDGACGETYAAIRGVDAFDNVCAGIRAARADGAPVSVRVTLQRANYRELAQFVGLARELGVQQVSFLPVDVANPHAFGRIDGNPPDVALGPDDLPVFETLLSALEREHAEDFATGLIAESPHKLRRILQYFGAVRGLNGYAPVRCNAPEFSAVIDAQGGVRPCFFIPGSSDASTRDGVASALNSEGMRALRGSIRAGERRECATCVCPLWRDPEDIGALLLPASRVVAA